MTNRLLARFCLCLTVLLAHGSHHFVQAQYSQNFNQVTINGQEAYFYQPTLTTVPRQAIDLDDDNRVVQDICKNAYNFMGTARGKFLHPGTDIPGGRYAYDMSSRDRNPERRKHSCPRSWKTSHTCPETDQHIPMRQDGPWFTSDLEPGTTKNMLMDHRDLTNTVDELSKIRYTCDEFPPASWVEGGDGEDSDQPAQTRCAAMRCAAGIKAEQDWQATAHSRLRDALTSVIDDGTAKGKYPYYSLTDSVVFFDFYLDMREDGNAASVIIYNETALGTVPYTTVDILQGFARRDEGSARKQGLWDLSYDEFRQRIDASGAVLLEHTVSVNETALAGMPKLGIASNRLGSNGTHGVKRKMEHAAPAPLAKRATAADLTRAHSIVSEAMAASARRNGIRMARPLRNVYGMRPGSAPVSSKRSTSTDTYTDADADTDTVAAAASDNAGVMPLLRITDEIADAAALVAEVEARGNGTTKRAVAATGTYWMQGLARKGTVPWGDDAAYVVFRNVLDYGAVGDGVTDDTKAIKKAMTSGSRCGEKCNGSTTKNAIVYFPPGHYLISSTVPMPFGTQVIGDASNRPTLVAAASLVGLGVLSTDEYTGGDGGSEQYYINTANFYRQIRNIAIDITGATAANISCLHYQVAQATSLQNVELIASTDAAKNQIGMFAENGSGGQISDVTFTGGSIGFYGGSQQFTAQRLTFSGCGIGVHLIWDWGWVWKSITMSDVGIGFRLVSIDDAGSIGSVSLMDSSFTGVATAAVVIAPVGVNGGNGSAGTGLVLENVALSGVAAAVQDTAGTVLLDGSAAIVSSWVLGTTYEGTVTARSTSSGGPVGDYRRHAGLLDSTGAYYERAKPQYEDKTVDDFMHVKDLGATGDGTTDDTAAFQSAVYSSLGKVLFVDAGSYILTSTIHIPSGAKIVGETWSQLVASGAYFEDASNPKVLIQVGTAGSVGSVELQDLLFTTRGPTVGLVLVEWNLQAESAGAAGLWDCHARIGGATGTQLTPAECPPATSGIDAGCSAASLMMHLTSGASGYFENMWLWGADHIIDDADLSDSANNMTQCSIYIARGFLIESTHPTWLYGTASEHAVFYQYNFHHAANIFAGFVQTESAYFQPTPPPPAPFAAVVGGFAGDPDYTCAAGDEFSGCDESWAVLITASQDIFIASAGVYSWFSTYSQACIDAQQCQKTLVRLVDNTANVRIQNLVTIGAKYMVVMDGEGIAAAANLNVDSHPFWALITNLDVSHDGATDFSELVWIDPAIWDMPEPSFTCIAPCYIKLPPYPGVTSTVDYPLITVSSGAWTSTITEPPITISEWILDVVTIAAAGDSGNAKRNVQAFSAFRPVASTTPFWPSIVFTGGNGQLSTTAPTQAFPTPPVGLVQRDVVPIAGRFNYPEVNDCDFFDPDCLGKPWYYIPAGSGPISPDGDDDENADELQTTCPISSSTRTVLPVTRTSSSSTISSTTSMIPVPSPLELGDPSTNTVRCYDSGEKTENVRMQDATADFCNAIKSDNLTENYKKQLNYDFPYNGGVGFVSIVISLTILDDCTWNWNLDECERYLDIPTDSCDCGGINGKHGGIVTNNCYRWRIDPNRHFEI